MNRALSADMRQKSLDEEQNFFVYETPEVYQKSEVEDPKNDFSMSSLSKMSEIMEMEGKGRSYISPFAKDFPKLRSIRLSHGSHGRQNYKKMEKFCLP